MTKTTNTVSTVRDLDPVRVSRRVLAVTADTDPVTALGVMRQGRVRHLPVIRGDQCVGLLTEVDLLVALAGGAAAVRSPVGELCQVPAPTVPAGATSDEIAAAILAGGADAALVVEDSVLVGIVTTTDLLIGLAALEASDEH